METEGVLAKGNCEKIGLADAFHKHKTADGKDFSADTKVTENLELTMVFEKIEDTSGEGTKEEPKDEEPKMGVEISTIAVLSVVAVIALAGLAIAKKK